MTEEQEKLLRIKLDIEIPNGCYTISNLIESDDLNFRQWFLATGKFGYIDYLVELEKKIESLLDKK